MLALFARRVAAAGPLELLRSALGDLLNQEILVAVARGADAGLARVQHHECLLLLGDASEPEP